MKEHIQYNLTKKEVISLLNFSTKTNFLFPFALIAGGLIGIHTYIVQSNRNNVLLFLIIALFIVGIYKFYEAFNYRKKIKTQLEKEQSIDFKNNELTFNSGKYTFSVPIHNIVKIKKTKYYYRFYFRLNKYENDNFEVIVWPHIPCRIVREDEMKLFAMGFNIKF